MDKKVQIFRHDTIAEGYAEKYRANVRNHMRKIELLLERGRVKGGDRILEVGIGTGDHMKHTILKHKDTIGIDISKKMVKEAKRLLPGGMMVIGDAENLPFRGGSFDNVSTVATLHHTNYRQAVREFSRVCKTGGVVGAVEPNPLNPQQFIHGIRDYWAEKGLFKMFLSNLRRAFRNSGLQVMDSGSVIFVPTALKDPSRRVKRMEHGLERVPIIRKFAGVNYIIGKKA